MPTKFVPGMGAKMRTPGAARASAMSLFSAITLFTRTPCGKLTLKRVTVGPATQSFTMASMPKSESVCCNVSAVSCNSESSAQLISPFVLLASMSGLGNSKFASGLGVMFTPAFDFLVACLFVDLFEALLAVPLAFLPFLAEVAASLAVPDAFAPPAAAGSKIVSSVDKSALLADESAMGSTTPTPAALRKPLPLFRFKSAPAAPASSPNFIVFSAFMAANESK